MDRFPYNLPEINLTDVGANFVIHEQGEREIHSEGINERFHIFYEKY